MKKGWVFITRPCNCLLPNGLVRRNPAILAVRAEARSLNKKKPPHKGETVFKKFTAVIYNYSAITSNSTSVAFPFPKSIWAL